MYVPSAVLKDAKACRLRDGRCVRVWNTTVDDRPHVEAVEGAWWKRRVKLKRRFAWLMVHLHLLLVNASFDDKEESTTFLEAMLGWLKKATGGKWVE